MFKELLSLKLGFSYQVKFFLILWLRKYNDGFSDGETIKDLSFEFDVPVKWVSMSLDELYGRGYFVREKRFNSRNRMYTAYAITEKLKVHMDDINCNHTSHLEALLFKRSESTSLAANSRGKKIHSHFKLVIDSRLLLAVLISISDDCGVVTDCGIVELGQLAGMSKDKVKNHIKLLVEHKYINRTISGLTGKYIFGVRQGVYFMNLKHPAFLGDKCQGKVFDLGEGHQKGLEAYNLFKTRERLSALFSFGVDMQEKYLDSVFFQDANNGLADYFQGRINHFAKLILINHPKPLIDKLDLKCLKGECLKELMDIESELIPESVKRNIENLTPTMARLLAEATLYSSIVLAGTIRDKLIAGEKADLLRGRFIINKYANKERLGNRVVKSSDIIFNIEFFT
jgi:DNA-binding MarR family transcriptional regulator